MEWEVVETELFSRRFNKYSKKHLIAAAQAYRNSERYFKLLKEGVHPAQIKAGFVHNEGAHGIIAVDSSGRERTRETRLYLLADMERKVLSYLTIGGKSTQTRDLQEARALVQSTITEGSTHNG